MAACVGVVISTSEKNSGMLKVRMCLLGRLRVYLSQTLELIFVTFGAVAATACGMQLGAFGTQAASNAVEVPPIVKDSTFSPDAAVVCVAFLASLGMVFLAAFAGRAVGLLIGSAAICSSIMVLAIVALPILGSWDPRNGAAVLMKPATNRLSGSSVFSSYDISNQVAFFSLLAWITGVLVISAVLFWRTSPFRK